MKASKVSNVVIAIALVCVVAANAFAGDKAKVHCFDVAFHEKTSRLFVAGSVTGTHVFEVTDGKLSFATTIHDGSYHRNLKISGDRLYVADCFEGLLVFDISGKVPVCTWRQQGQRLAGMGIYIHDDHAYLVAGLGGLHIFDISKPDSPKLVGKCKDLDAWDVWVSGKYAYIADFQTGVTVIDVSRPSRPQKVSSVTWDKNRPTPEIIRGEGEIVYVAAAKQGLVAIDVSNPREPKVTDQYISDPTAYGEGLCVRNGLVYLANLSNNKDENGLIVIDARNPNSLKVKGKCTFGGGGVEGVCVAGNRVFVTNRWSGIRSIDVSDPDNPRLVDSSGPLEGEKLVVHDNFLETEVTQQEQKIIDYLEKTKSQILDGRKFDDLSTATNAYLTLISACYHQDQSTFEQVLPFARKQKNLSSPEAMSHLLGYLKKATVRRVMIENESPQENDLCAIFSLKSPEDQVFKFGYIEGAWRLLGADHAIDDWIGSATAAAEKTRRVLRQEEISRRRH